MSHLHPPIQEYKQDKLGKLKVLLAEDNEVNQLLAKSILHHWGLESRTATTGFEVLELMEKEDFDVVLMDIQMPEKSGIEAAAEIRRLVDIKKKNVPIIALTANALKGEEKKYMAVGMNDFLTKPFKERDLYDVMVRVLKLQSGSDRSSNGAQSLFEVSDEPLYNLQQLEEIGFGNDDFILSLVKIFIETIPVDCEMMVESCKLGNWDKVSKLAHKIKPTIDNMQISSIRQDIRAIEIDAKNKVNPEAIENKVHRVNDVINRTVEQLITQFGL